MGIERVPEFAIVGHPNEGKSSVVSTLAEDDSVRVSPIPGETLHCQTFPVIIDGKEIIRFIDTPGFQNPTRTLAWMKAYGGEEAAMLHAFRKAHRNDPDFRDDCELFKPIADGAGIIYVVDGSRPVRHVDRAEMEILRLTGRPRMAILNSKEEDTRHLDQWKSEFRKHFNAIRVFNAHKATYAERIDLLENLKSIDQDWQPAIETVISAFKSQWDLRNTLTTEIICGLMTDCLTYRITATAQDPSEEGAVTARLQENFIRDIAARERAAHQKIRKLFKHNIFAYELPAHSILREDLFSEKTWRFLGLSPGQLIAAAGLAGGAVGVAIDIAAAGHTLGVFSAIGGLIGAGWAALSGGKRLAKTRVLGLSLGGHQIQVGPMESIQFIYVLIDRALIYYSHIINWAHGRRDYGTTPENGEDTRLKTGITTSWDDSSRAACQAFFSAVRANDAVKIERTRKNLHRIIQDALVKISHSEKRYGLIFKTG